MNAPSDNRPPSDDDLLVGELTAALFESQRTDDDVLPPALAERLRVTGEALVRTSADRPAGAAPASVSAAPNMTPSRSPVRSIASWTGWLAAAVLAVMVVRRAPVPSAAPTATATAPALDLDTDVRLLRATLMTEPATVSRRWTPTEDSTSRYVEGEVLWNPTLQKGVMRIIGLAPNDQKRWSYQLWIFDKTRDQKYPVDGGVFNVAKGQVDLLIPIRARLPVGEAVLFAVTVEKPGGVVVSTRERIAMTAKL
jgi:hypothetical protein